jgi:hypothetical protein
MEADMLLEKFSVEFSAGLHAVQGLSTIATQRTSNATFAYLAQDNDQ